jgi:hypothetical protein
MPEGTDQARTAEAAEALERMIRTQPDALEVHRFVGFTGPSFYYNLQRSPPGPEPGPTGDPNPDPGPTPPR